MAIHVSSRLRQRRVHARVVTQLVRTILDRLRCGDVEVGVTFLGDRAMRRLNREYRHKNRTTDVLAFAGRETYQPPTGRSVLGDVVISVPQAQRQARAAGHSVDAELTMLIVHGMLHLLGYDHETNARDARRMFATQRRMLTAVGTPGRYFTVNRPTARRG
ncbi:MAG: rRNA maturation RNase YbeY [Nitrospiraceae bacterium]